MIRVFTYSAYALVFMLFFCLFRAVVGPTVPDRVAAINLIGTKTVALLVLIAIATEQHFFFDVALVYALISFLMTVGMAKYFEKGRLG
ncbi:MAG: cation:proton antiporter [Firmicutes bacterium]|jgi:multicomponent Na+:H+ antiporter subunit F|nr:cation:proton antiporter [Bacillota bacterium]